MARELKIDRAVYLVDDETRTYRFLRRNPHWEKLDPAESDHNKRQIDGYTRVFRDGRRKTFRYRKSRWTTCDPLGKRQNDSASSSP